MPRVQLPATTPKRRAWNKGRIIGQKRPLLPKQVWAIRARLELAGNLRDLTLFNVAIDSKLRGCDLVRLKVKDLVSSERVRERVTIAQSKTGQPVQFELTENTRDSVTIWTNTPEMMRTEFMFPSRFHDRPHISTRQYGRLVRDWVTAIGLEHSGYGTHSLRRNESVGDLPQDRQPSSRPAIARAQEGGQHGALSRRRTRRRIEHRRKDRPLNESGGRFRPFAIRDRPSPNLDRSTAKSPTRM